MRVFIMAFFSSCDFCATHAFSQAFSSSLILAKRAGGTTKRTAAYVSFNMRSSIFARSRSFAAYSPE